MGNNRAFRKMSELMAALSEAERALNEGRLGLEGLESACGNARELYERLVVLRHKAREAALSGSLGKTTQPVREEQLVPPPPAAKAAPVEQPEELPSLRLDTKPPDISPRQTSLIEAIEEVQEDVPPAPKAAAPETPTNAPKAAPAPPTTALPTTLAEKLEKAPVTDLAKAISLSHKFWFVAELFNGDRIGYEKTVTLLNGMGGRDEAVGYVEKEVVAKLKKPADPEALATFMDLLQRRYA